MLAVDILAANFSRLALAVILMLLAGVDGHAAVPNRFGPYTTARAIQELSPKEAAEERTVRIRAVVIFVDISFGRLFVQDDTAGIYIFAGKSQVDGPLRAGDFVAVDGVTAPGAYSPCITNARIRQIGTRPLPKPEHATFEEFLSGGADSNWAEVEGIVRSGEIRQGRLYLNVKIKGGVLIAILVSFPEDWRRAFIDAKVRISGAVAQIHYQRRQTIGVRLFVPPGFLRVMESAPDDPFSLPESSADDIRSSRKKSDVEHRIRVRGVVTGVEPGQGLYLEGKDGKLEIKGFPPCSARAGDVVDAVGFPGAAEIRPSLLDSVCRKVVTGARTDSIPLKAEEVLLSEKASEDIFKYDYAASTRYDMSLVRIEGTLLQKSPGPDGTVLLLASGGKQFIGTLPGAKGAALNGLETGSRLQLTGVCLLSYDPYRRAESFRILLRTPGDVAVIQSAPWWNLKNAFRALSFMAVVLAAALLWGARQGVRLSRANRTLQRLSFRDALTGVGNRREFDKSLEAEISRASRSSTPISLIMLDIDYFKLLNDRYGHQRGDECLILVARALQSVQMRITDVVARYGGEEFAVILPGSESPSAWAIAENIRVAVANLALCHEGSPFKHITVSAGVATIRPGRSATAASLIELADHALYQSKVNGRNRVSCAEPIDSPASDRRPSKVSAQIRS